MVLVVKMEMVVFQTLVEMVVFVVLSQMQPHSKDHQQKRRPEKKRRYFAQ
jgi:hypothetical protein